MSASDPTDSLSEYQDQRAESRLLMVATRTATDC
jgi:hypothetical protein